MPIEKVGLNLDALKDIDVPTYNASKTAEEWSREFITQANVMTNDFFGLGTMLVLFFYMIWKLGTGLTEANEQFSTVRAIGISAGVTSMIGLTMLNVGIFTQYFHVVIFMGITFLMSIMLIIQERQ